MRKKSATIDVTCTVGNLGLWAYIHAVILGSFR